MHEPEVEARTPADRDALQTRILILEAALACIAREADRALDEPELIVTSMCRVAAIARQAIR